MCGGFVAAEFQSEKSLIQSLISFISSESRIWIIYYYLHIYYSWFKEDAQPLYLDILEDAVMKKILWSELIIWTFKLNKMLRNWSCDEFLSSGTHIRCFSEVIKVSNNIRVSKLLLLLLFVILFCIMLLWRRWSSYSLQCSADNCGSVKQIRWEINPVIIFTVHSTRISTTEMRRVMTEKITHSRKE